jgi:mono/diheme cytochrome c family protein
MKRGLTALVFAFAAQLGAAPLSPEMRGLMAALCTDCHGPTKPKADLNLQPQLDAGGDFSAEPRRLELVIEMLESGEMPSPKAKRPATDEERAQLLAALREHMSALQKVGQDDPGQVVMARLTSSQYRNVIRDLTGHDFDAGEFITSQGGAGEGFENVGAAQNFPAGQFEKYVQAARAVVGRLRASPLAGFEWSQESHNEVTTPAERREEIKGAIRDWYGAGEERCFTEHRDRMEAAFDNKTRPYLEAAWRYQHRTALGLPEATFQSIAASFTPALEWRAVESWHEWLTTNRRPGADRLNTATSQMGKPLPGLVLALFDSWRKLPKPGEAAPAEIQRRITALAAWWTNFDSLRSDDGKPDFAWSPHGQNTWGKWPYEKGADKDEAAQHGRLTLSVEIGGAKSLYLTASDCASNAASNVMLWHEGVFEFAEGKTQPWSHGTLSLAAPGFQKITVPAGALRFTCIATPDPAKADDKTLMQAIVLREPPHPEWTRYIPDRAILVKAGAESPKSNSITKFVRTSFTLRNRVLFVFTTEGFRAERNYLADMLTDLDARDLGGPWPDQPDDGAGFLFPDYFNAAAVREKATPQQLAELHHHQAVFRAEVFSSRQRVQRFLKAHGHPEIAEGAVPDADALAKLTAAESDEFQTLITAAQADETKLEARAAELLTPFASAAWRRDLAANESARLIGMFRRMRQRGLSFDAAIKVPLVYVLSSPQFFFYGAAQAETEAAASSRPLASHELATRLSFALWGSIPDVELRTAAARDELRDPDKLMQQARRMLADPKARGFAIEFAGRWFGFADFITFERPDAKRFPQFTPALRRAMFDESVQFFTYLARDGGPVTDAISADYTFANDLLAIHYGLKAAPPLRTQPKAETKPDEEEAADQNAKKKKPAKKKEDPNAKAEAAAKALEDQLAATPFVKTSLTGQSRTGGLLGMGSVLTATSAPLRTSPVLRGVWVLEQLLGEHLPAPPPDIPPLSDDDVDPAGETIARQLARHRASQACAKCHDKIDPMGLTLENYDPIGRWRTQDTSGHALVTEAPLKDGSIINGVSGLRSHLLKRSDDFERLFCKKLLGYLLGRPVLPGDAALLARMQSALKEKHVFSAALEPVLGSKQFRERRIAPLTASLSSNRD